MKQDFLSRKPFLFAIALAAMALVVGCGSDDGEVTSANGEVTVETGSLSKEEFIDQAETICKEAAEKVEKKVIDYLQPKGKIGLSKAESLEIIETIVVPAIQEKVDRISELGAPEGDGEEVVEILAAMQQSAADVPSQPKEFTEDGSLVRKASKLAKTYGFTVCSQT